MSLRILQPGRACFGAQEKMCISSNQIEPAGRGAERAKRGLSGRISRGRRRRGRALGSPADARRCPPHCHLLCVPKPGSCHPTQGQGLVTLRSLVISERPRPAASLCLPTQPWLLHYDLPPGSPWPA